MTFRIIALLLIGVCFSCPCNARQLWGIIVADTDDLAAGTAIRAGRDVVVGWVRAFESGLADRGIPSRIIVLDGPKFTTKSLRDVVNGELKDSQADDAILFYYIGHGQNAPGTPYPTLAIPDETGPGRGLSFGRVVEVLKARQHQFLFAMAEACNGTSSGSSSPLIALGLPGDKVVDLLFASQDIVITSASPGELASADRSFGGIYTAVLINALSFEINESMARGRRADWENILNRIVTPISVPPGRIQTPQVWIGK